MFTPAILLEAIVSCPAITSFRRHPNLAPGCNTQGGDYFYDVKLNNVFRNDLLILNHLPENGISIVGSSLNGVPFTTTTFLANIQYNTSDSYRWLVDATNGSTQTLRLYYCWAIDYPEPVESTTATALCSEQIVYCAESPRFEPRGQEIQPSTTVEEENFSIHPNPGYERVELKYQGAALEQAVLRIISSTGQLVKSISWPTMEPQQPYPLHMGDLPAGVYFLCLQTRQGMLYRVWEKVL